MLSDYKKYLLKQILECQYLNFLYEYLNDDIIALLKQTDYDNQLNDKNLEYISKYIEIKEFCIYTKY